MTTGQTVAIAPESEDADIPGLMRQMGTRARSAALMLASATTEAKNKALRHAASRMRARMPEIMDACEKDIVFSKSRDLSEAMIDRLRLDEARIDAIAGGMEQIAELADPVGQEIARWTRPNGLDIARVRVPLGVIGIIYESRPNVTADAGALCLKSGNAAILRGGSESLNSSAVLHDCLREGLVEAGLPEAAIQLVPTRDRAAVGEMLTMTGLIDIIVPRGGQSLIERVHAESRVPVLAHLQGLCHTYIHASADPDMARDLVVNAKMRRPGICGATETVLIDSAVVENLAPMIVDALIAAGCEVRADEAVQKYAVATKTATDEDWQTEYLDAIVSIKAVDGLDTAIDHVNRIGSHHTDAIITGDEAAAARFVNEVDSAIVMHNASTQFADGGEFGMGAEIGISTGKLHARGPVGVEQLTTFKYVVRGSGQARP